MQLTTGDGTRFDCSLTRANSSARGAFLVLHDWWGVMPYNQQWAGWLADQGLDALVVDLYDRHHPPDAAAAGAFMRDLDQTQTDAKLHSAIEYLAPRYSRIGLLGWSFGGLQAQQALLAHPTRIQAAVFFYCRLLTDDQRWSNCKAALFSVYAETERTWPQKQHDLEALVNRLGLDYTGISFNAAHGFANPDSEKYERDAVTASQAQLSPWLARRFG